jgi:sulfur relay (sulfurtransferase) DsrC/TusE family protein
MQTMQEQLSMMYQVFTEGKAKQTDKLAGAIENPYVPKKLKRSKRRRKKKV